MTALVHGVLLTIFICLGIFFSTTNPTGLDGNLYF